MSLLFKSLTSQKLNTNKYKVSLYRCNFCLFELDAHPSYRFILLFELIYQIFHDIRPKHDYSHNLKRTEPVYMIPRRSFYQIQRQIFFLEETLDKKIVASYNPLFLRRVKTLLAHRPSWEKFLKVRPNSKADHPVWHQCSSKDEIECLKLFYP